MITSRCGLQCDDCEWKEKAGCLGCIASKGKPFHQPNDTVCPIAECCQNNGYFHCGECDKVPCDLLTKFSNDPENGDKPKGKRIQQCLKWAGKI